MSAAECPARQALPALFGGGVVLPRHRGPDLSPNALALLQAFVDADEPLSLWEAARAAGLGPRRAAAFLPELTGPAKLVDLGPRRRGRCTRYVATPLGALRARKGGRAA